MIDPDYFVAYIQISLEEQLCVRLGEELRTGELYYLGIDPRNRDHDCTAGTGLRRLIDGWIEMIVEAEDGCLFYLPFDFSDEFTRWLACDKRAREITVVFGWAEVEGWAFSPSDFAQQSGTLTDFRPDDPANPQTFYVPRVLSNLRSCRAMAEER